MPARRARRAARSLALSLSLCALASSAHGETQWLSIGAKQWSPRVVSKTGIGTAKASAVAKADPADWGPPPWELVVDGTALLFDGAPVRRLE